MYVCLGSKKGDPQEENSLIHSKDFTEGALVKPSILGNQVVRSIEALFMANRDELMEKSELLTYFTTKVLELIELKYPELPKCHLKQIVARFLKARVHFWANRLSQKLIKRNEKDIRSEACASWTTKAQVANELR